MSAIQLTLSAISLDVISDAAIIKIVRDMKYYNKLLDFENLLFESFLLENDPSLLKHMEATLEKASKAAQGQGNIDTARTSYTLISPCSSNIRRTSISASKTQISATELFGVEPMQALVFYPTQANFFFRVDLIEKFVEKLSVKLEKYVKLNNKKIKHKNALIIGTEKNHEQLEELKNNFEKEIVIGAINPITSRIPGDRFLRWLNDCVNRLDGQVSHLRLQLECKYKKLCQVISRLKQNKDISESLRPIDVEIEQIKKNDHVKELDEKYARCKIMNQLVGNAALELVVNTKMLQAQEKKKNDVINLITELQKRIHEFKNEKAFMTDQVLASKRQLQETIDLCDNYTVPPVLEYISKINELDNLNKKIRVWERKFNIQRLTLKTALYQLRKKTGLKKPILDNDIDSDTLSVTFEKIEKSVNYIERKMSII